MNVLTVVGVVGFVVYLIPYALVQLGRLDGNSWSYSVTNVIAAGLVLVSLIDQFNLASVLTQSTWIVFGTLGLVTRAVKHAQRDSSDGADTFVPSFELAPLPPVMTTDWLESETLLLDRVRRGRISRAELDQAVDEIGVLARDGSWEHGRLLVTVLDASPSLRATIMAIVLNPYDADDALQETLLAITHSLPSFRGESSLFAWANGIARNKAKDVLRRKGRPAAPDPHHELPTEQERFTSQWATNADVAEAIAKLSPKLRTVFELADIEGLTYREVADHLDIERNTVASRLRRARAELQLMVVMSAPN